jgi:hypothetical protein
MDEFSFSIRAAVPRGRKRGTNPRCQCLSGAVAIAASVPAGPGVIWRNTVENQMVQGAGMLRIGTPADPQQSH